MNEQTEDASLKRILLCIQKFCTNKVCFQGLTPDEQVAQFQNRTNDMLSEVIKMKSPDAEKVETLAANYTLVMTNSMSKTCRENRRLSFKTDDYDAGMAKQAIDNQFKLSWKYKTTENILKRRKKCRKILVYVAITVFILLGVSLILSINANQFRNEANIVANSANIFDFIIGIFGGNQARDLKKEGLLSSADILQNTAHIFFNVGLIVFLLLIACIIALNRVIKSSGKVLNDWEDYQLLCDYLEYSSKKAMEAKKLWQY